MRCHPLAIFGADRALAWVLWRHLLGGEVGKDSLWPADGRPGRGSVVVLGHFFKMNNARARRAQRRYCGAHKTGWSLSSTAS
jgi:hypothetical protein